MKRKMRKARALIADKKNVMIFTGSGASAPSGLPTFSGDDSIVDWGIGKFRSDERWRSEVWGMALDTYWDIEPNPAHKAIDKFVAAGRGFHVTSNVDGLADAVETCGSFREVRCDDCGHAIPADDARKRWMQGDAKMLCNECGGLLRPSVTFIGESFPSDAFRQYGKLTRKMDALVVIGASKLVAVWYSAYREASERGLPIVSINKSRYPWSMMADVALRGDAAELTPILLG